MSLSFPAHNIQLPDELALFLRIKTYCCKVRVRVSQRRASYDIYFRTELSLSIFSDRPTLYFDTEIRRILLRGVGAGRGGGVPYSYSLIAPESEPA